MTVRWVDAVVIVIAVAVGVAAVIAGGVDDSPGLQGLGVMVVIGSVALAVRRARRRRHGGHRPRD